MIRREAPSDVGTVNALVSLAFGDPERVPNLVRALRAAPGTISLVSTLDDEIIGHVMLSRCRLDALPHLVDVLSLSPLAVHPAHQKQGLGGQLIAAALVAADAIGIPLVFLEGSPDYYARHGFVRASEAGFRSPSLRIPDPAFQVAKLSTYEEWMTGTFVYSDIFWEHDCVGLR